MVLPAADFTSEPFSRGEKPGWVLIVIVGTLQKAFNPIADFLVSCELCQHREILIVFQPFADEFQADAFDRNLFRAADDLRPAGIEKRAVAVAAIEIYIFPDIGFTDECFVHAVIQLSLHAVLP